MKIFRYSMLISVNLNIITKINANIKVVWPLQIVYNNKNIGKLNFYYLNN